MPADAVHVPGRAATRSFGASATASRRRCTSTCSRTFADASIQRETLACRCGHIVTAPAPDPRRREDELRAELRRASRSSASAASRLRNIGSRSPTEISESRSHAARCAASSIAAPASSARSTRAALALVPTAADVHADETSMRQQDLEGAPSSGASSRRSSSSTRTRRVEAATRPKQVLGDSHRSPRRRSIHRLQRRHQARRTHARRLPRSRATQALRAARASRNEGSARPDRRASIASSARRRTAEIVGTDAHLALRRERSRARSSRGSSAGLGGIAEPSSRARAWAKRFATCSELPRARPLPSLRDDPAGQQRR